MTNKQSKIKPIKIKKQPEQRFVLGARIIFKILGHKNKNDK